MNKITWTSIEEVAAMLDLPEGTVKSYLHRARKAMAIKLEVRQ
jgi:DNA-directed RNA polymerase specialized sigma24 family protein